MMSSVSGMTICSRCLGAFVIFELTAPDRVVAGRELDRCRDGRLGIGDIAAEIAITGIDKDVGRELRILGADRGRPLHQLDLGHLPQRDGCAIRQRDQHLTRRSPADRNAHHAESACSRRSARGLRQWS